MRKYLFTKQNESSQVYFVSEIYLEKDGEYVLQDTVGEMLFSFDKKNVFNFFTDYPDKLTEEQREIFRKEYPRYAKLKEK